MIFHKIKIIIIFQDIEWSWDGNLLWILQARPITTNALPENNDSIINNKNIFSNKNSKEVMGHVLSTMTWSAFSLIINNALNFRYKSKGIYYSEVIIAK